MLRLDASALDYAILALYFLVGIVGSDEVKNKAAGSRSLWTGWACSSWACS